MRKLEELHVNLFAFVRFCCLKIIVRGNKGVPMLRTTNLTEMDFHYDDSEICVKKVLHQKNKKSQLNNGDLLVARHGFMNACILKKT